MHHLDYVSIYCDAAAAAARKTRAATDALIVNRPGGPSRAVDVSAAIAALGAREQAMAQALLAALPEVLHEL
jgi:hypothetical protein